MSRLRLRIREIAQRKGVSMSQLQRQTGLTMSLVRRYWYNTQDGRKRGKPLTFVSFEPLAVLARFLEVEPGSLLTDEPE